MLCRNFRNNTLLELVVGSSKCFCTRNSKKKDDGLHKIIKKKVEDKLMFGSLLETKKSRIRREKLEEKGKIPKNVPSPYDSEFAWIMKSSSKLKVLKMSVKNEHFNLNSNLSDKTETLENNENKSTVKLSPEPKFEKQSEQNEINTESDYNKSNKSESDQNTKDTSSMKLNSSNQGLLNSNLKVNKDEHTSLPKQLLQNLIDFSLFNTHKNCKEKLTYNSKIMSFSVYDDRSSIKYPSVTKVLSATMSEESKAILQNWKDKMIKKLGLQGFEKYQAELLEDGSLFHSAIVSNLTQKPLIIPEKIKPSFQSLSQVFKQVANVRAVESDVIHQELQYRGKIDCVAEYRGTLCLIDWKKSSKSKLTISSTFDAPFQLASYIGAVNADLKYPFQIDRGIIIVAYTNGNIATVHEVANDTLQYYWQKWLQRLQQYYMNLHAPL